MGPLESIPIDEMKKVFETNFFGVIRMIKEVMPDMKKRKGGHIIVVSSVMGLQGEQGEACWGERVGERVREGGRGGGFGTWSNYRPVTLRLTNAWGNDWPGASGWTRE